MLNGEWGFINNVLYHLFDITGPAWLNERWLALGSAIYAHLWKWLPFWTVILLAGRMSISQEIYDAAEVDGATGLKRFIYITFPLLANMYLVLTLLATIFLLGDFNSVFFVTGGGPANSTHSARDARHPLRLRHGQSGTRRGGGHVGPAGDDPARNHPHAPHEIHAGEPMTTLTESSHRVSAPAATADREACVARRGADAI